MEKERNDMDIERELILKYTTKEERRKVRTRIKAFMIVTGGAWLIFCISQFVVWLFYEYGWLNGIWDVVPPAEDTPLILTLIGMLGLAVFTFKWFSWDEPDRDERSIMKERYGVEYDTGEMGGSVENDE